MAITVKLLLAIPATGDVYIYGYNEWASDHRLWSEVYKSVLGSDINKGSVFCYKNVSKGKNLSISDGTYYIHLDVDGPLYTGCQGFEYAQD